MKKKTGVLAVALLSGALATCTFPWRTQADEPIVKGAQAQKEQAPRIEVVFVLDTTGSMGGLLEGAKQKIWSLANRMAAGKPNPDLRIGLVAFRDRGDEYVTRHFDLTDDIDAVYKNLMTFRPDGGGDTPEDVNAGLSDAIEKSTWSKGDDALKIIFLVGDAPPHENYGTKSIDLARAAIAKGIIVNTIRCGMDANTEVAWREISRLSDGSFTSIGQTGDVVAIATPMDEELARLNAQLSGTVVACGDESLKEKESSRRAEASAMGGGAAAERAGFAARKGVLAEGDLVEKLAKDEKALDHVAAGELPEEMQKMDDAERKAFVEGKAKERAEIIKKIEALSADRGRFLAEKQKELGGGKESFDDSVMKSVRDQAKKKGIAYE